MTSNVRPAAEISIADANVLYSYHQRNVFITLAQELLFALRWTKTIEQEWHDALRRNRPELRPDRILRTIKLMNEALPDALIAGDSAFEVQLAKTDPKDRHVAAAAIKCAPSTLVTWNLAHFDVDELRAHRVAVVDPDTFLCAIFDREPIDTLAASKKAYGFLKKTDGHPTWSEYLDALKRDRLVQFAERLRQRKPIDEVGDDEEFNNDIPSP